MGHEAERAVADRLLIPRGAAQLRAGNRVEHVGRKNRQVGEHVGEAGLRMRESHDHGRVVGIVDERHVGEVGRPRVPGRRVTRRGQRPHHVARRGRGAVVPAHARLQPEHETLAVARPRPRAGEVGLRDERGVVPRQRGEQHVPLHLLGERMHGEQRVDGLEVRPRREHDGAAATRRPAAARREHRRHRSQGHEPRHPSPHARILAGLG